MLEITMDITGACIISNARYLDFFIKKHIIIEDFKDLREAVLDVILRFKNAEWSSFDLRVCRG